MNTQYQLTENGTVHHTGTSTECCQKLIAQFGGHTTIASLIARNIIIKPKS